MYTKPGWIPVTTELNDPVQYEGAGTAGLHHSDWCEDKTCYCQRG